MFTSQGRLDPGRLIRLIWGLVTVTVTGVLLASGGLEALQTISILAAFPFMVLMMFMAGGLLHALRDERRQQELHEALLRERLQRLLDERDRQDTVDALPPRAPAPAQGGADGGRLTASRDG